MGGSDLQCAVGRICGRISARTFPLGWDVATELCGALAVHRHDCRRLWRGLRNRCPGSAAALAYRLGWLAGKNLRTRGLSASRAARLVALARGMDDPHQ